MPVSEVKLEERNGSGSAMAMGVRYRGASHSCKGKKALIGDSNHEPIDVAAGPKEDRSFTESNKNWNFDMSR
jgi:hypothetical protein